MKKIWVVILSIIIVFVTSMLFVLIGNKTFFKDGYSIENIEKREVSIPLPRFSYFVKSNGETEARFYNLGNPTKLTNDISKYVESLQSCYDESYFYDPSIDVTITKYHVEKKGLFHQIDLDYQMGNICENQYVLSDDWMEPFINQEIKTSEIVIDKCIVNEPNINCETRTLLETDVINLLKYVAYSTRTENKSNISMDQMSNYYLMGVYYILDGHGYVLQIFSDKENRLVFKRMDSNDHSQNAIYQLDGTKILETIYNNRGWK